jgi:cobalt-zinc-cadmium efflux system membrane fusion protein
MKFALHIMQAMRARARAAHKALAKFASWFAKAARIQASDASETFRKFVPHFVQTVRTQAIGTYKAVRRDPSPAGIYQALRRAPHLAAACGGLVLLALLVGFWPGASTVTPAPRQAIGPNGRFVPTEAQWTTLTIEPIPSIVFRPAHVTEAKIAVDEDRSTPIFSPYAGRVVKLLAKPGDEIKAGQPLFVIEAADMVQAQNDFISALATTNKARSQVNLAQTVENRLHGLYDAKAMSLREWQQAQADLTAAQNDLRSAETTFEAARNRLRIFGKTDEEIAAFQETGRISAETPIYAPIGGTIVQRKVGPGQYIGSGATDPVFVIGDLSTVWLVAYVRETEAAQMQIGQPVEFTALAYPGAVYRGNIAYVAAILDATNRRLLVRATIQNPNGELKPEMYATVTIFTGEGDASPAVSREAVIYEGDAVRVWVVDEDSRSLELRNVQLGLINGRMMQVLQGLKVGEKVVTKGSLFIDRAASGE